MRQYNVSWTHIYHLLRAMSVVVGTGAPYAWSISADQQWLQVFLVDDETVPDITQVTVDLTPVIPVTPLPPPAAITVTGLLPIDIFAMTDEDTMLIITGAQFSPSTRILLAGVAVETIAVSSVELALVFSPRLAQGFGAMSVQVQDGTQVVPPSPSPLTLTITSTTKVTSATAGLPGAWAPATSTKPLNLQALTSATPAITAAPTTDWAAGQYVVLGDQSEVHWNGTAWVAGRALAPPILFTTLVPAPAPLGGEAMPADPGEAAPAWAQEPL